MSDWWFDRGDPTVQFVSVPARATGWSTERVQYPDLEVPPEEEAETEAEQELADEDAQRPRQRAAAARRKDRAGVQRRARARLVRVSAKSQQELSGVSLPFFADIDRGV